jgi:hypothetical protein
MKNNTTTAPIAADLKPGDVVQYDKRNDWKIIEIISTTAKTITVRIEYMRFDFIGGEQRLGTQETRTFRKATSITLI